MEKKRTVAEQVRDLENTRAAKAARMQEIVDNSIAEERSTDEAEAEEFDTLDAELKAIDQDLKRLHRLEALTVQRGTRVVAEDNNREHKEAGSDARGPTVFVKKIKDPDDAFPGQSFTRMQIAKAVGHIRGCFPSVVAQERWGKSHPLLVEVIKAGVAGGGSGSGEWGAELIGADNRYTGDFIEFLYAQTIYDRLPLRQVPANVTIKGQDGAATAFWVGESKSIPATKPDFSAVSLTPLKVAAIAVTSNELLRDSTPSAEMLVRDSLVQAAAQRVDTTFLSTTAASAGVSPAGILNGVMSHGSHGSTVDGVIADVKALYAHFISAANAQGLAFVMNPALAKSLSLMLSPLGQTQFPSIMSTGGTLLGDPVFTGENVNVNHFILLKPSDIWRIGDTGIEVSVSREATIEQDGAPQGASDTPTAASATLMSMFGTESTAFKIVRSINFQKRRASAVQYVDDADYGASDTST